MNSEKLKCKCGCSGKATCMQRTMMDREDAHWSPWYPCCKAWASYESAVGAECGFYVERKPIEGES